MNELQEDEEYYVAHALVSMKEYQKKPTVRRCRHTVQCLLSTCKAGVCCIVFVLAFVGVIFIMNVVRQTNHDQLMLATDPHYNIFSDVRASLDSLQEKYTKKKALCLNLDEEVKSKEWIYTQAIEHEQLKKDEYEESIRRSAEAKQVLENSRRERKETCVVAKGIRLSAGPIQDLVVRTTDYDYREDE